MRAGRRQQNGLWTIDNKQQPTFYRSIEGSWRVSSILLSGVGDKENRQQRTEQAGNGDNERVCKT
jgi:hypothetical protein